MSLSRSIIAFTLLCAALVGVSACSKKTVSLELSSVGDTMTFDKKDLTVPAGSEVTLILRNNAKVPEMVHNWVLVQPGKIEEVGHDAITVPVTQGYIPDNPAIIAHTALVKPGTSGTLTFTAPPPGTYDYLCTVPGHYVMMRGTLTVR